MRISDWSSDVCSSDLAVGIDDILPLGTTVSKSDPIAVVHAADEAGAEAAAVLLQKAFEIGQTDGRPCAAVRRRITARDPLAPCSRRTRVGFPRRRRALPHRAPEASPLRRRRLMRATGASLSRATGREK